MEKGKISVIVPVYKVEQYLNKCVESIVNQTYRDLEIILVDDGSPDNCPDMCDEWARKDTRIKVIHKENGGLSDARNAGLEIAQGEYIGFVDSDDWIAPAFYEMLYTKLHETDSDIAACGVQMVWEDGLTRMLTKEGATVLDNNSAMAAIIEESWLKQPVWYKLYKRSVVDGILFEKGKLHEDVFWSYKPISKAQRVCVFDEPLYFYRQRNSSIMSEPYSIKRLDAMEGKLRRVEFLKETHSPHIAKAKVDFWFSAMYHGQYGLCSPDGNIKKAVVRNLRNYLKMVALDKKDLENLNTKNKVWLTMAKMCFVGTCRIRNFLKIGV